VCVCIRIYYVVNEAFQVNGERDVFLNK
jgi:hypothetical protein